MREDANMQNLLPLIIIVAVVYFLFLRKGGMGCCGGHTTHESGGTREVHAGRATGQKDDVVDLREDEYTILPSKKDKLS